MPKRTQATIYPNVSVKICQGDKAITCDLAKKLLGWESEEDGKPIYEDYLLVDNLGHKVRCLHNTRNRPMEKEWALTLAQEVLNRRWRLNLQTIIVGKYGQITNGQHRLIGLVLACQTWKTDHHWKALWPTEPTLESLIAFGGDEDDEYTRTLDNVKTRTLADVLYTNPLFAKYSPKDRKVMVRAVDYAVRLLWKRTGMVHNAFTPRQTHSEAIDFIARHPRVLEGTRLLLEEDYTKLVRKTLGIGYASALLYLMAASNDSLEVYQDSPCEESLTLAEWDKAAQFWVGLQADPIFQVLREVLTNLTNRDDEGVVGGLDERLATVIKAWKCYINEEPLDLVALQLNYDIDEAGFKTLNDPQTLGGLDCCESKGGSL